MRRSTRRSSMAISASLDSSLDSDGGFKRVTTRRSSILPPSDDSRNVVGNFSAKFSMSSFVKKVEDLTNDQRIAIERVGFGNLLRIHQHMLRKNLLVEWMERWDCERRAFLLLDRELTITPIDAALILGLRVTGQSVTLNEDEPLSVLEEEYGASRGNRKLSVSLIERRLESLGDSTSKDFIRTFLLFTFGTLLFHNWNAKVDSRYLSLLEDVDNVSDYAWGVAVLEDLFKCLSRRKEEQTKNMEGCLILLQIWSYEHIDIARPNLLDCSVEFPRACRWESSRCNSSRQWFAMKFNELEEDQVTWKLQPTATESDIDIIKEIYGADFGAKEVHDTSLHNSTFIPSAVDVNTAATSIITTTTSMKCMRLPPRSSRRRAIPDEASKGDMRRSKQIVRDDISEDSRLSEDTSEITVEFPECSSSSDTREIQQDQRAETSNNVKEDYQVLKTQYLKLKDDMNELTRTLENQRSLKEDMDSLRRKLGNQLSLNQNLQEELAHSRKQLANRDEEIQRLRMQSNVVDQVEIQRLRMQSNVLDQIERTIFKYFDQL